MARARLRPRTPETPRLLLRETTLACPRPGFPCRWPSSVRPAAAPTPTRPPSTARPSPRRSSSTSSNGLIYAVTRRGSVRRAARRRSRESAHAAHRRCGSQDAQSVDRGRPVDEQDHWSLVAQAMDDFKLTVEPEDTQASEGDIEQSLYNYAPPKIREEAVADGARTRASRVTHRHRPTCGTPMPTSTATTTIVKATKLRQLGCTHTSWWPTKRRQRRCSADIKGGADFAKVAKDSSTDKSNKATGRRPRLQPEGRVRPRVRGGRRRRHSRRPRRAGQDRIRLPHHQGRRPGVRPPAVRRGCATRSRRHVRQSTRTAGCRGRSCPASKIDRQHEVRHVEQGATRQPARGCVLGSTPSPTTGASGSESTGHRCHTGPRDGRRAGPGDAGLVSAGTVDAIARSRTAVRAHHPASVRAGRRRRRLVRRRVRARRRPRRGVSHHRRARSSSGRRAHGEVLYAVPGSPRGGRAHRRSVVRRCAGDVEIVPAMSFLDLAWARLRDRPDRRGRVGGRRAAFRAEGAGSSRRDVGGAVRCAPSAVRDQAGVRRAARANASPSCGAWALPTSRSSPRLERPRPIVRARSPHVDLLPEARRAGCARPSSVRRTGAHLARRVPVGSPSRRTNRCAAI